MATNILTQLLIIDPQNDFMDIEGAALPVQGANADMNRLAAFIDGARDRLDGICVTLDSHHRIGIERPAQWRKHGLHTCFPMAVRSALHSRRDHVEPRIFRR
jgi:nicotinamidase-related amidase